MAGWGGGTVGGVRVREIWRYPVKSMGGETLLEGEVTELGIVGDRGWSVYDVETTTTLTARRTPELLFASARLADDDLVITLPDGSEIGEDDHAVLSRWLQRDVELRSAGEHNLEAGGTYEIPLDAEHDANWVSWTGPGGAFHDSDRTRVSLVSESTMREWDRRRFRANVILDGEGEDRFIGGMLRVGGAVLDVTKAIDRCVIVTRPQPGLHRDLDVLRTINAERNAVLAIACLVVVPGRIALGDDVVPVG